MVSQNIETSLGAVIIGRNEGQRLIDSLDSVVQYVPNIVYVDSGSTDGSIEAARARGVHTTSLDLSKPFTAARARNAGWRALKKAAPSIDKVLFVDGDCQVQTAFVREAIRVLAEDNSVVAVCGYRRERFPEASIYNRVCDVEWRMGGTGECSSFGGDVVIRLSALETVGGYNDSVIAAEDDELSIRLRRDVGRIVRIRECSTTHDAEMHSFLQWWNRAVRCGYAYAQVGRMHRDLQQARYFTKEENRTLLWGFAVPAIAVALSVVHWSAFPVVGGLYLIRFARIVHTSRKGGLAMRDSIAWGLSCILHHVPAALGVAKCHLDRLRKIRPEIIEYKEERRNS